MPADTTQAQSPAAPPPPGRPAALTREQVLVAAMEIIDQDGVEALTMRRLGQARGHGLGYLTWEPAWLPGTGWNGGESNPYGNLTMFDWQGTGLPSLDTFRPP